MGAPEPVLTLRRSVNAAAFKKVAPRPTNQGEYDTNWFVRRQPDCGTPIYDQLAAARPEVVRFLHEGPIQVELDWPKGPAEDTEEQIASGEAAGIETEGSFSG